MVRSAPDCDADSHQGSEYGVAYLMTMSPLKMTTMRMQSRRAWAATNPYGIPKQMDPSSRAVQIAMQMMTPRRPNSPRAKKTIAQKTRNGSSMTASYNSDWHLQAKRKAV